MPRNLMLHCASALAANQKPVLDSAGMDVDWEQLTEAAEYHGLVPALFAFGLPGSGDPARESILPKFETAYRQAARQNLVITGQLLALLDRFDTAGIAVVPLKGPVLAETLYPQDPVLRPFSDIDLLVRKKDVPEALRLLRETGYRLEPHMERLSMRMLLKLQSELLLRADGRPQVDLQWEVAQDDYPFRFDVGILWRSLVQVRIAGRAVAGLSPEALLLFLCVHGAKHKWSRLQWLGDVARLLRTANPPDWDLTLELAAEAGCRRPLLLGVLLAHEVLRAPVPDPVRAQARAVQPVRQLAGDLTRRFNQMPPVEPTSLELIRFNARLAERPWAKVRHFAALLAAPTEAELVWLPLPEPLFFLYYSLRLARLIGRTVGLPYAPDSQK